VNGKIKAFYNKGGYGFIEGEKEDYFFHISRLPDKTTALEIGQKVNFKVKKTKKGKQARNIIFV